MQILAMLTMLVDHLGIVFYPKDDFWRIVGRLALPLYAYGIVQGYLHTTDRRRYVVRLLVIAFISQIPYMLALHLATINIVGTLLVSLIVLFVLDRVHLYFRIPLIAIVVIGLELIPFEYGGYAFLLVLIYRYYRSEGMAVLLHFILNILYVVTFPLQLFSIFSTLLLTYRPKEFQILNGIIVPRWIWRSFYPAHLFLLAFFNNNLF